LRLIIGLVLAVALCLIVFVAANLIVWRHHDSVNARRLKSLQADAILRCDVAKITRWNEKEEMNADLAGSTHGIGFGGRTLTSVTRVFRLNDAEPASAIDAFTACAQSSGWVLGQTSLHGV